LTHSLDLSRLSAVVVAVAVGLFHWEHIVAVVVVVVELIKKTGRRTWSKK